MNKKIRGKLIQMILERKKMYLKLRLKKKLGYLKNTSNIKKIKRKIAKIMTKINKKVLL